jgi:hypothetical protein
MAAHGFALPTMLCGDEKFPLPFVSSFRHFQRGIPKAPPAMGHGFRNTAGVEDGN